VFEPFVFLISKEVHFLVNQISFIYVNNVGIDVSIIITKDTSDNIASVVDAIITIVAVANVANDNDPSDNITIV
jgi:hypothetical protein